MRNTWNGIDNLINCKKKQSKVISSLKRPSDNGLPIEISNILNKYFSSIGGSLASHVPPLRIVLRNTCHLVTQIPSLVMLIRWLWFCLSK